MAPLSCSNLVSQSQSQSQLSQKQIQDLTMAAQEGIALKGEVSRLKMELGLTVQNQREAERRVTVCNGVMVHVWLLLDM